MRRFLLFTFFIATAARAEQSPLLARWIDKAGGAERVARIAAIHRIDDVDEDGMAGTREEWTTAAMQRRERVDHVHDEAQIVFDGANGWRRDWNGFVEKLAGDDLRRQSDIALLHSLAALTGAAGPPKSVAVDTLEFH
ncbi:MAG TPA: hypothetical protein VF980_13020, partial [Thermoanaerobaculia bacterium]